MILNPKAMPVMVNDVCYEVTWFDYGSYVRLNVFKDNHIIGYRCLPLLVDRNINMVKYVIKSLTSGGFNGFWKPIKTKKLEASL